MILNRVFAAILALCVPCSGIVLAQDAPGDVPTAKANVDPRADAALRRMSAYLGKAQEFSFRVTNMVDHVLDNGQKVQLSDQSQCSVHRPDGMKVTLSGDTRDEIFWYDGKMLTLCDRQGNEHGRIETPATIEQMLDRLAERYNMVVPLAELCFRDCYQAVIDGVTKGTYLGLHQVNGIRCHHLAFRQALLDWQIWIEEGDKPLPRKVVITYREIVGQPQYVAIIDTWDLAPKFAEDEFKAKIPAGSKEVDLASTLLERARSKPAGVAKEQLGR